jgi:hypothetical protein
MAHIILTRTKPWGFTCTQSVICTMFHVSFLLASVSAFVFSLSSDTWSTTQSSLQTFLMVWGYLNFAMQMFWFALVLLLNCFQDHSNSMSAVENTKMTLTSLSFLWIASNLSAWLIAPFFLYDQIDLGLPSMYVYCLGLFAYTSLLVIVLCVVIAIFVWPKC